MELDDYVRLIMRVYVVDKHTQHQLFLQYFSPTVRWEDPTSIAQGIEQVETCVSGECKNLGNLGSSK